MGEEAKKEKDEANALSLCDYKEQWWDELKCKGSAGGSGEGRRENKS